MSQLWASRLVRSAAPLLGVALLACQALAAEATNDAALRQEFLQRVGIPIQTHERASSIKTNFWILPVAVFGNSRKRMRRGAL